MTRDASPLDGVNLYLVDDYDSLGACLRWLGQERPGWLGIDTETTGLEWWWRHSHMRTLQVGDEKTGWTIPHDFAGAFRTALPEYLRTRPGVFHHASFDLHFLREAGFDLSGVHHNIHDSQVMARLVDPLKSGALKSVSTRLIDPLAGAGSVMLAKDFRKYGWDWHNVPIDWPTYWQYAALDPVLTVLIANELYPKVAHTEVHEVERVTAVTITTEMERLGVFVNMEYVEERYAVLGPYLDQLEGWIATQTGNDIQNPNSDTQVRRFLLEQGCQFTKVTPKAAKMLGTDRLDDAMAAAMDDGVNETLFKLAARKGQSPSDVETTEEGFPVKYLSLDGDSLSAIGHPVADAVKIHRDQSRIRNTYLKAYLDLTDEHGYLHPSIWSMEAKTGRMCLPDDHHLLTRRGLLAPDEIRVGDETMDASGKWVPVRSVHRYEDAPITVRSNTADTVVLEATPEHRWVTREEGITSLEGKGRRTLLLAPDVDSFDFEGAAAGPAPTSTAALVGWLVSDGRCLDAGDGSGLRAYAYQTEGKFLAHLLAAVPAEGLMYDRVTAQGDRHHEVRLRARWLRPILAAEGLDPEPGVLLREDPRLVEWVLGLDDDEVHDFLYAVWLADGSTAHPQNRTISCRSDVLRTALRIAGIRCGWLSVEFTTGPSEWSTDDRTAIRFRPGIVGTRHLQESRTQSDVWCVSTDTETFTAWGPSGPYVTGNSISRPSMQNIPHAPHPRNAIMGSPGNVLVLSDYDQIEGRLMAHRAEDRAFIQMIREGDRLAAEGRTGYDLHSQTARQVFGIPMDQSVPKDKRDIAKAVAFATLYGAGIEKLAGMTGLPLQEAEMFKHQYLSAIPGIEQYMRRMENEAWRTWRASGAAYVENQMGRRWYIPHPNASYKLVNYSIQGEAAIVLKKGLIRMHEQGLSAYMRLPVHDEILNDVPEEDAEEIARLVPQILRDDSYDVPLTADSTIVPVWGDAYR